MGVEEASPWRRVKGPSPAQEQVFDTHATSCTPLDLVERVETSSFGHKVGCSKRGSPQLHQLICERLRQWEPGSVWNPTRFAYCPPAITID